MIKFLIFEDPHGSIATTFEPALSNMIREVPHCQDYLAWACQNQMLNEHSSYNEFLLLSLTTPLYSSGINGHVLGMHMSSSF